jgi:hypothetical protein
MVNAARSLGQLRMQSARHPRGVAIEPAFEVVEDGPLNRARRLNIVRGGPGHRFASIATRMKSCKSSDTVRSAVYHEYVQCGRDVRDIDLNPAVWYVARLAHSGRVHLDRLTRVRSVTRARHLGRTPDGWKIVNTLWQWMEGHERST